MQGQALQRHAAADVRILVVGNPCNTNCLITMHNAPEIPRDRFFAMTRLDENRAKAQLAKKAGLDVTTVTNVCIWGNHSSTQFPDFYNAKIKGKPVTEVITDEAWLKGEFITSVQQRGAEILKTRGASSAASAAVAIVDTRVFDYEADAWERLAQPLPLFRWQLRRRGGADQLVPDPQRRARAGNRAGPADQRLQPRED